MDCQFEGSYDSIGGYQFVNGIMSPDSEEQLNYSNFFNYKDPSVDLTSVEFPDLQPPYTLRRNFPSSPTSSFGLTVEEAGFPDDNESDPVLKYISQVLLEEDIDDKPYMFHDSLALQAAEKPFFDALRNNYPRSPNQHPLSDHYVDNPNNVFSGFSMEDPTMPEGFNMFTDRDSMIQFQKGVEEANKFLPKAINLVIDLDNITYPEEPRDASSSVGKSENEGIFPKGSRMRRIHYRDDEDLEGERSSKQLAMLAEDADDLSEIFDKVLVPPSKNATDCYICSDIPNGVQPQEHDQCSKGCSKRVDNSKTVVDLRTMLILCAQALTSDDRRTTAKLLKQIRQNSSPLGDGSQRLAHFLANALEARLAGTGSQIFTGSSSKRTTAAQILKAYQLFVSFCPFQKISIMFSNFNTMRLSEKRKKVHIIDFGILYGFQWPALIHHLSERPEGPPMLRITGIELPQSGFKPAERVEETGRRLAKYCERYGVPFEFYPIAQKWETIELEDLKLERDEFTVVNCLYRFKNLLDETVVTDSPRDAILSLIRKIKPDLFVHAIVNGSFNAPFFLTRFKEALFYYSTLFDMYDTTVPRENPERSMYEQEFYGREIINIVACEGTERVERPETYKQWQCRNMRSGFKQLPLDSEIMQKAKHKMKCYHKDYSLDVDGNWAVMGWKGRVIYAISAWVPS